MANEQRDYLKEYDAAPDDQKYRLARHWMKTEPLPFFKQLREERPVLVTSECTLVTLYSDLIDVMQMPKMPKPTAEGKRVTRGVFRVTGFRRG